MVSFFYSLSFAASLVSSAVAHGLVESVSINGKTYQASQVIRKVASQDPLTNSKSDTLICNTPGTTSTKSSAVANPGDKVTFNWQWTTDRHPGPMTTWLARCGDSNASCNGFNAKDAVWFKIHETGIVKAPTDYNGGTWASDKLKADGNKWTISIPQNLKSGNYLLRHDITAMHLVGKPEFYPSCTHLKVGGSGTGLPSSSQLVSIPGYLSTPESQKALKFNIFDIYKSFKVAGPAPITSFSGSKSGGKAASAPIEDEGEAASSEDVPKSSTTAASPTLSEAVTATYNSTAPTSFPTSTVDAPCTGEDDTPAPEEGAPVPAPEGDAPVPTPEVDAPAPAPEECGTPEDDPTTTAPVSSPISTSASAASPISTSVSATSPISSSASPNPSGVDSLPECPTGTGSSEIEVDADGGVDGVEDGSTSYDYSKRFVAGVKHARGLLKRMNAPQGKQRLARWH